MVWTARFISFAMGFLSLSQEILWIRIAGFAYKGAPQAFGGVLGLYLIGIAGGAGLGKRYCNKTGRDLLRTVGLVLLVAGAFDLILPWLTTHAFGFGRVVGTVVLAASVILTALLKSMVFPIAHHMGSVSQIGKVGTSVSKVYFANVIGSTLGPLLTGFLLLQILSLQSSFMLMAVVTLTISFACLLFSRNVSTQASPGGRLQPLAPFAGALAATCAILFFPNSMMQTMIENTGKGEGKVKQVIENRYGIIHTLATDKGGDIVFGGNLYDGRINIDYMVDSNWVSRVYFLSAFQPKAKRVLVIGMSAGSWTRVLSAFPAVEKVDVVEINPGYIELASQYPELRPLLSDPRISIYADDGRRWLKRHPQEKYDLIVMNTTYHWRAYATLLLSQEFLRIARDHLTPEGILAYNSTFSWDSMKTASSVLKNVYLFGNFVVAGDSLKMPKEAEGIAHVSALKDNDRPLINPANPRVREKLHRDFHMLQPYSEPQLEWLAGRPLEVITDQNMLSEYRRGKSVVEYLGSHGS